MARLYADENFPLPVVNVLRSLRHDVLTVQETGHGERRTPDEAILIFASGEGRAVLTLNRKHFIRLHNERPRHAGIIVCTVDPDFPGQARRIHHALREQSALAGQLIRIHRPTS